MIFLNANENNKKTLGFNKNVKIPFKFLKMI